MIKYIKTNNENNRNSCLFKRNNNNIKKIFKVNHKRYQLTGDQKNEDEIQLDLLNSIISLREIKKTQINAQNINSRTININPDINNNSLLSPQVEEEKDKEKNISQIAVKKNNGEKNPDVVVCVHNNDDIGIEQNDIVSDLLLNLYEKGMYDPENQNHQKGSIILTEKQKDKWKLTDYHRLVYATCMKDYHPFSFFYGTKYKDLVKENGETLFPEGKLINYRDWQKEPDYSFNGIFKGIEINNKVGLVIIDPFVKKKYSGLVGDIIFQLLKVPFGHHMSLNVKIFEPKCLEERMTNIFSFANRYLIPANDPSLTPYERFKSVITFILSGMYIPTQQLKPFNPYLGETFQGELSNGAKVYVEQVTHKPLCARLYMFYQNIYKLYGYFNFSVRSEGFGSTMYVCQQGPITVEFPELDERVTFHIPEIKIVNARNEEGRANLYSGSMVFVDIKNSIKAVIQFGYNKNIFHEIKGCTFKCNYPPGYQYIYKDEWKFGKKCKIDSLKSDSNFMEEIKGSWVTNLFIGDKLYWDIKAQIPEFIKPTKTCLPSDGRFREDLCWLYKSFYDARNEEETKNYEKISQELKFLMEDFNRWERKRRSDYNEKLMKGK